MVPYSKLYVVARPSASTSPTSVACAGSTAEAHSVLAVGREGGVWKLWASTHAEVQAQPLAPAKEQE